MELDWTLERAGPATLVTARLRNERATDRRVRLENRLDGPVLPPRRNGTPEVGWDREGVTTVVPAGETVALGYACPAPEREPPAVVDGAGPAAGDAADSTPEAAVRELGDHRPPRAVLGGTAERAAGSDSGVEDTVGRTREPSLDPSDTATDAACSESAATSSYDTALADDAATLLDRYRTRIRTAEALNAAGVPEATALLEANGGLAGVESLATDLDADARELRALARVATSLADRAAATTPPSDALRRLS